MGVVQKKESKKYVAAGSAILLVLGVMTIVLLGALALERTVLFQVDIALTRVRVEQQFRIAEGILAYGVMLAQENFDVLASQNKPITLDAGSWQIEGDAQYYRGAIVFTLGETKNVLVTAQLYDSHTCVKMAHCIVSADEPQKGHRQFRVTDYSE